MDTDLLRLAAGFSEAVQSMIRQTRTSSLSAFPAMDKLPHANTGADGIVHIGDFWHPMSPFSGKSLSHLTQHHIQCARHSVRMPCFINYIRRIQGVHSPCISRNLNTAACR